MQAVPREEWPETLEESIKPMWSEPHGDRQQEIVLIGQGMDQDAITKVLDSCLLTEEEKSDFRSDHTTSKWSFAQDPFAKFMGLEEFTNVEEGP